MGGAVPTTKPQQKLVPQAKTAATQPVSRLIAGCLRQCTWLRQTPEHQLRRPMPDRLEALVWS
jgi:hypothetical protein